ncbi:hypothetical protein [Shewanella baltica]|uniref:hypothetical protein n=1 Tax=Shewanella baltica TaxID=62322 RepID=UPI000308E1B6|nr:hypothetical protein [Shewanella baltica]
MNQFSAHQNGLMHQNATAKSTIVVQTRIQLSAEKILNHVNQLVKLLAWISLYRS